MDLSLQYSRDDVGSPFIQMNYGAIVNWSCLVKDLLETYIIELRAWAQREVSQRSFLPAPVYTNPTTVIVGILYEID